jgi:hypothetical protein
MKFAAIIAAAAFLLTAVSAHATSVQFDKTWKEQRFSLFSSNDFDLRGETLGIGSSGTVSMLWTRVPSALWPTRNASWQWQVHKGVPATDLTRKGGDDRNLALYFVFLPKQIAARMQDADVLDLMEAPGVRVLMYVWGGNHVQGQILPTPYLGERGRTIIRRMAGTGAEDETVDLAKDYQSAFGEPMESLVGLAISADSDDTGTRIDASLSRLRLLP